MKEGIHTMIDQEKRTWAEISLGNIRHNYHAIRAQLPEGCRFLGVVKADAYGHGAVRVSRLLQEEGADYLAVACLDEALELRQNGIDMPLLILGVTPAEYTAQLIEHDITQAVGSYELAEAFSREAERLGKTLRIHIKVDSGMSRTGFLASGTHFADCTRQIAAVCRKAERIANAYPDSVGGATIRYGLANAPLDKIYDTEKTIAELDAWLADTLKNG